MPSIGGAGGSSQRAQVVVAMAVVVTVALVPIAAAYLQLGYVADHTADRRTDTSAVTTALSQAVADAEGQVAGEYTWRERSAAATATRAWLDTRLDGIETPRDSDTTAIRVAYNHSFATHVATNNCPSGHGRDFGPCQADGGIVVQERAGETVIVAVAFDVRIRTPDSSTTITTRVEP